MQGALGAIVLFAVCGVYPAAAGRQPGAPATRLRTRVATIFSSPTRSTTTWKWRTAARRAAKIFTGTNAGPATTNTSRRRRNWRGCFSFGADYGRRRERRERGGAHQKGRAGNAVVRHHAVGRRRGRRGQLSCTAENAASRANHFPPIRGIARKPSNGSVPTDFPAERRGRCAWPAAIRPKASWCSSSRRAACGRRSTRMKMEIMNFRRCRPGPRTPCESRIRWNSSPTARDAVRIDGAAKLDDIVLERITKSPMLPATPEIEAQLSGDELLWNLPGTTEEKEALHQTCALGCHSFQQIFKNRYDRRSWATLVSRMLHRGGGPLINDPLEPVTIGAVGRRSDPDQLAGEGSRAGRRGWAVARVSAADRRIESRGGHRIRAAAVDAKRARRVWRLERKRLVHQPSEPLLRETGHAHRNRHRIPDSADARAGSRDAPRVVRKNGEVLLSEPWSHKLLKLDPRPEK